MRYFIWLILVILIVFRYFSTRPVYKNGDTVRITATIYSDPIDYSTSQSVKIAGLKVSLPIFPEVYYGDRVTVTGIVSDGKLTGAKLISDKIVQGFGSGIRNKIITFYQQVLPPTDIGSNRRYNFRE
jgi:hypothetical protein